MQDIAPPEPPGLPLVIQGTDRRVLQQVWEYGPTTRAELAAATGISKPTVSESVRRLTGAGLLAAGGERTGLRGRVATIYRLATTAGRVLALQIDQNGIALRSCDLAGEVRIDRRQAPVPAGDRAALTAAVRAAVVGALADDPAQGPVRALAVSVANPVDPAGHRVVTVPGSPFPEGEWQPAEVLADLVPVPVLVENDVNLAALAERHHGAGERAGSFAYLYVGAGFGVGLLIDGRLVRGAHGLAGEIGHLPMGHGPSAGANLAQLFGATGFGRSDAPSNDLELLRAVYAGADRHEKEAVERLAVIADLLGRAIAAVCAVVDPELVLVGGPVPPPEELLGRLRDAVADRFPGPVRIERSALGPTAPLVGAMRMGLDRARAGVFGTDHEPPSLGVSAVHHV